jgi:hypothetical protein
MMEKVHKPSDSKTHISLDVLKNINWTFRRKNNPLFLKFRDSVCKNIFRIHFPGIAQHLLRSRY